MCTNYTRVFCFSYEGATTPLSSHTTVDTLVPHLCRCALAAHPTQFPALTPFPRRGYRNSKETHFPLPPPPRGLG